MTISSNNRKAGPFIGNGSAATFPFTFKVFQASDLFVVRLTVSTGAQSTLVLGTDYTVTLNLEQDSNPGGSITLVAGALASGYNLIITSDIGNLQPTDLTNQGGFYPEVINDSLDRATIQIQQLQEQTDRTLKYPVTDPSTGTELPAVAQRAGKVLTFDELGAPIAGPSVDEVGTILDNLANITTVANDLNGPDTIGTVAANIADVNTVASNIADVNTVADNIADVGTVATNIADVIIAADNVADINNFADVYLGARTADPTTRTDGSPLQAGDMYFNTSVNELRLYSGTVWVAGTAGTVAVQRFSGTGSQTAFTLSTAPSGENNTQVYINGVYQQKDTYGVTGTTLTFSAAPPAGTDNIEVVSISTLALGQTTASLVSITDSGNYYSSGTVEGALQEAAQATTTKFIQAGTGAVSRSVQSKLRDVVNARDFGAVGDGVTDDTTALQNAINSLPTDGGQVFVPNGNYRISRPLILNNRQVRLTGQSYQNTILQLSLLGTNKGNWASSTAYAANDIAYYNGFNYLCLSSHTSSGSFATDLADGKWTVWCLVSVRQSDCEVSGFYVLVTGGSVGIAIQGAARAWIHHNSLGPTSDQSGYGLVMSDLNAAGVFSPGSYTHTIGPGNLFAVYEQGLRQLYRCIITDGTGGGINATKIIGNHLCGDRCIDWSGGGGNFIINNLLQSATGYNSGSRPFIGGQGIGLYYAGEIHCIGNYFERFEFDFKGTGAPSAVLLVEGHASDASNSLQGFNAGSPLPSFMNSGYGVSGWRWDDMVTTVGLTGNNQVIQPNMLAKKVTGNGATRTGISLGTAGAQVGQMFLLFNDSWAFELVKGGTADFGDMGDRIFIGQAGASISGYNTYCSFALFIYTAGGWKLISHDMHGIGVNTYQAYNFSGNNEQMAINAAVINVLGNGASRTGATFANGSRYGQEVTLYGNSWSVAFASGAASWGTAGAPTFGNGSGQVLMMKLMWTPSGWAEVCRTVRP